MAIQRIFECDSCGHEVDGWTKKELLDEGWEWHATKRGREFVMCDACSAHYKKRWDSEGAG